MLLETVTAKGIPALDGTALAGLTVHVGGVPGPQLRATTLLYPFSDVSVPLNCADESTDAVTEELEMARL